MLKKKNRYRPIRRTVGDVGERITVSRSEITRRLGGRSDPSTRVQWERSLRVSSDSRVRQVSPASVLSTGGGRQEHRTGRRRIEAHDTCRNRSPLEDVAKGFAARGAARSAVDAPPPHILPGPELFVSRWCAGTSHDNDITPHDESARRPDRGWADPRSGLAATRSSYAVLSGQGEARR